MTNYDVKIRNVTFITHESSTIKVWLFVDHYLERVHIKCSRDSTSLLCDHMAFLGQVLGPYTEGYPWSKSARRCFGPLFGRNQNRTAWLLRPFQSEYFVASYLDVEFGSNGGSTKQKPVERQYFESYSRQDFDHLQELGKVHPRPSFRLSSSPFLAFLDGNDRKPWSYFLDQN